MSVVYSKPLREYKKPKLGIGDEVFISKYNFYSRKGFKLQFTQEIIEIVAITTQKPPTYTIEDEQEEAVRGKLYEKELNRVI